MFSKFRTRAFEIVTFKLVTYNVFKKKFVLEWHTILTTFFFKINRIHAISIECNSPEDAYCRIISRSVLFFIRFQQSRISFHIRFTCDWIISGNLRILRKIKEEIQKWWNTEKSTYFVGFSIKRIVLYDIYDRWYSVRENHNNWSHS